MHDGQNLFEPAIAFGGVDWGIGEAIARLADVRVSGGAIVVMSDPHVFQGAGCLSTHWPAGNGIVIEYLRRALPPPGSRRFYFDYGTETLDAGYEVYEQQADAVMRAAGCREGVDWVTRKFPDAEHSERSWRKRVHVPLLFLLEGQNP